MCVPEVSCTAWGECAARLKLLGKGFGTGLRTRVRPGMGLGARLWSWMETRMRPGMEARMGLRMEAGPMVWGRA